MRNFSISHDAVFIAMEEWEPVWRRSQNLAMCYARRFPQQKILFVPLAANITHTLRQGSFRAAWQMLVSGNKNLSPIELPNLFVFAPLKFLPDSLPFGRIINNILIRSQVKRTLSRLKMTSPVFWINPYWGYYYTGKMGESCVLYDIGDDWNAITQSRQAMRWTRKEDEILTRRADAVIVVSEYLRRQKSASREDIFYIPNGVASEFFTEPLEGKQGKRTESLQSLSEELKPPVLGYIGMLHIERLDIDLLVTVAKALPEATLVLFGPNLLDERRTARLEAEPNIFFGGQYRHQAMPEILSLFDVCLVPNLVNDFSESQNPLKLWEYLASGLPIVSTNVAGFRDYPDLVRIANSPQEFVESVQEALAEGTEKASQRQSAVRAETWDARLDSLLEVIAYAKVKRAEGKQSRGN